MLHRHIFYRDLDRKCEFPNYFFRNCLSHYIHQVETTPLKEIGCITNYYPFTIHVNFVISIQTIILQDINYYVNLI